jgi:hypothetical protein
LSIGAQPVLLFRIDDNDVMDNPEHDFYIIAKKHLTDRIASVIMQDRDGTRKNAQEEVLEILDNFVDANEDHRCGNYYCVNTCLATIGYVSTLMPDSRFYILVGDQFLYAQEIYLKNCEVLEVHEDDERDNLEKDEDGNLFEDFWYQPVAATKIFFKKTLAELT